MLFLFYLLIGWCISFFNSAYHPDLLFRKYVTIKSKFWQKILICKMDPTKRGAKSKEEYQDRLLVSGIVFYAITLVFAVGAPLFLIYGPQTLTGEVSSSGVPKRLCDVILEYAFLFYIMVTIFFSYINTIHTTRTIGSKGLVTVYYITGVIMILMLVFIGYELVSTILGAF